MNIFFGCVKPPQFSRWGESKRSLVLSLFIFFVIPLVPLFSTTSEIVLISPTTKRGYSLVGKIYFTFDQSDENIENPVNRNDSNFIDEKNTHYELLRKNTPSFGFSKKAIWLHTKLSNTTTNTHNLFFQFDSAIIDEITFYEKWGTNISITKTGYNHPFKERPLPNRLFIFPITVPPNGSSSYFFKIKSDSGLTLPLQLFSQGGYEKTTYRAYTLLGFFFGALISLIVFNLITYLKLKNPLHLSFSIFTFSFLIFIGTVDGIFYQFFSPLLGPHNNHYLPSIGLVAMAASLWHLQTAYELNNKMSLNHIFSFTKAIFLTLAIITFYLPYWISLTTLLITIPLYLILIGYATIFCFFKTRRRVLFIVFSSLPLIFSSIFATVTTLNLLPYSQWVLISLHISILLQTMFLHLSFVDKLKQLLIKNIKQKNKLNFHSENLHHQIALKTIELNEKKRKLEETNLYLFQNLLLAKKLQNQIIPTRETLLKTFKNFDFLWLPKGVVGGDFYMLHKFKDRTTFALADCTGHGAPGALMSLTANSILEGALSNPRFNSPSEVLNFLDISITNTLKSESNVSAHSGLDLALFQYDSSKRIIIFSGAKINLYLARKKEITLLEGNPKSIGTIKKKLSYTETSHPILPGDTLYLTTDGFLDQSGGEKKFGMGKRIFYSLLKKATEYPFQEQIPFLKHELFLYQQNEPQLDDITLIALQIE